MAATQLSEMTEEELKKRQKELTFAIIMSTIAIIIMTVTSIISYSKKGYSTFTILPLIFIPLLTINLIKRKKIKSELALRKQ